MFKRLRFCQFFSIGIVIASALIIPQIAWGATYTVNAPDDTNDGSCTNPYINSDNDCTLREAITSANSNVGGDTVIFSFDPSFQSNPTYFDNGQYTITISSALPSFSGQTTINAADNWDSTNDRPGIRLYSSSAVINALTVETGSTNSLISGLEIEGFAKAISVAVDGVTVGTNCDGITDIRERNVLHGNVYGVHITKANSIVAGNYIGVMADGTTFAGETTGDIWIEGAAADNNTIGFREGTPGNCSVDSQRNVLAGTTGNASSMIYIFGTGNATAGDTATGANNNHVSGNYIGTDKTGTQDLSGKIQNSSTNNIGVRLSHAATINWIGTDGDGNDDEFEGNTINAATTGITTTAVIVNVTGANRIAGNYVGVTASGNAVIGTSLVVGIIVQGTNNIIGWCNSNDHASLCSDAGSVTAQRNVLGGASSDQIRFGIQGNGSYIYGNYIGVGVNGSSDISDTVGVFIHRASANNVVGGSGNRANVIKYNTVGIQPNGDYTGNRVNGAAQSPITNTAITNNVISSNSTSGIQLYWTENFGASSITINNNTVTNNGTVGIDVFGSSPTIANNTIQNNSSYGIYVRPAFTKRNVSGWNSNEATQSFHPADAATNILAAPTITSNTITGNSDDGIYQFDARTSNYTTLFNDNTINTNNSQPAITQAWYGAIEVLDRNGSPIPASGWASTTTSAQAQTSAAAVAVSGADMIFGPPTISYSNVTTWFTFNDYTINDSGITTSYNPSTITAAGTYTDTIGQAYTFDGVNNDTTYSDVLANGITTDNLYRFQIAKSVSSTTPAIPTHVTPTDGATTTLTPTLTTSTFSDAVESHTSSTWQIYASSAACSAGDTGDIYSVTSTTNLTSLTVPAGSLTQATPYYWRIAYTNSFGNTSSYSGCTSFTSIRTTPTLLAAIPNVSWDEDASTPNVYDLDNYFTDAEGESLTFVIDLSDVNNITATINQSSHEIHFASTANWFGNANLTIIACDTDNECATSNTSTLAVSSINDQPLSPTTGFSPSATTITTLTPTIRWSTGSDIEDNSSKLYYEIWISRSSTVTENPEFKFTSASGVTNLDLTNSLNDHTKYYYAIRTIDTARGASTWSAIQSFTTDTSLTAKQPNITLSKSVRIIASDLEQVTTATTAAYWPTLKFLLQQFSLAALLVCAIIVAWSIIGLLQKLPKVTQVFIVALQQPALAFASLATQDRSGNYRSSYSTFFNQVVPLRRALRYGIITALIFTGLHFSILALATTSAEVAPGDTIRYTVQYANTGEDSATNSILHDTLPSAVTLLPNSLIINRGGATQELDATTVFSDQTLTVALASVPANSSGTIQYDVVIDNPISNTSLQAPVASFLATELNERAIESNSVALNVISAAATVTVRANTGTPITPAVLRLYQDTVNESTLVWSATTNDQGMAQLAGLRAGTYWLAVSADAYSTIHPQMIELNYNRTTDTIVILSLIGSPNIPQPITNNGNTTTPTTNTNATPLKNSNTTTPTVNTNIPNTNTATNTPSTTPPTDMPIVIPIVNIALPTNISKTIRGVSTAIQTITQTTSGKTLTRTAQTLGILGWSLAAGSEVLLATTAVTSLADFYLIVARFLGALFGLRKKRQPWGVVYDAVTKRPLDPAYVSIYSHANEVVKDGITDLDGRYEFFLPANTYHIVANKTHYQFPSKRLSGKNRDVLYDHLYFGEPFTTTSGEVITRNIPLDPLEFDWNEFEKNKQHQFRFYHRRHRFIRGLGYLGYWFGFVLTLVLCIMQPNWLNLSTLALYLAISLYHILWFPKRKAVRLLYSSGEPVPFAIIRIYSARLNREIKSTVTDEYGRFYMLLEPGVYYWTVETHQPNNTYTVQYTSQPCHLKNGVIKQNIVIE